MSSDRQSLTRSLGAWLSPLRSLWRRLRSADRASQIFLLVLGGWIVGMSVFVLYRYYVFQSFAFDLGIFSQAFATTLQGRLFFETPDMHVIPSGSFLGTHFNLLMFLLLPLYALAPRPETLLTIQTVCLGFGAVPVWLISNRVLTNRFMSLLLAAAYLFNPAILSLTMYDFHLEAFLPFFLGMTFYSFLARRWKLHAVFLALSVVTMEFGAVLVFAVALAHLLRGVGRRPAGEGRWRFLPLILRLDRVERWVLAGTLLATPFLFYAMFTASFQFVGPVPAGTTSKGSGIVVWLFSSSTLAAQWTQFWLILFGTLLLLPFLAPRHLVMVVPWLGLTAFTAVVTHTQIGYQYGGAFAAPFLIWAVPFGLVKLKRPRIMKGLLLGVLLVSVALCPLNPLMQGQLPGIAYHQGFPTPTSHTAIVYEALGLIPPGASVLTQNNLFPQVSNRANAYVYLTDNRTDIEYLLADSSSPYYGQPIWGDQQISQWLPYFLGTGRYGVLVLDDSVYLIQKGYKGPILLQSQTEYRYDYHDFALFYGSLVADASSQSGFVLRRDPSTTNGTFFYGPYVRIPPGTYNVTFWMSAAAGATGGMLLDAFSPVNVSGGTQLAARYVYASDFPAPDTWTPFTLRFSLPPEDYFSSALECRGMYAYGGPFSLEYVTVTYVGAP